MKDRIQQIIDYKGISAGDLAELLDVQRSNISHILNGRNKPGAVFIEKLLQAFPDLNARWLLTGDGLMLLDSMKKETDNAIRQSVEAATGKQIAARQTNTVQSATSSGMEKTIEKIILLYSDGTFTSYNNK